MKGLLGVGVFALGMVAFVHGLVTFDHTKLSWFLVAKLLVAPVVVMMTSSTDRIGRWGFVLVLILLAGCIILVHLLTTSIQQYLDWREWQAFDHSQRYLAWKGLLYLIVGGWGYYVLRRMRKESRSWHL